MRLNHVTLPARDVEASAGFYCRLGLTRIVADNPHYARFLSPDGDTTLSLHRAEPAPAQASIHFEVDDEHLKEFQHAALLARVALHGAAHV